MNLIEKIHSHYAFGRRIRMLGSHLAALLPARSHVLDVGCGDGRIARAVMELRPDITVEGIDPLVREASVIPVKRFDGEHIPYVDNSVDAVMFVDVLHHLQDPTLLLREAVRVCRSGVLLKDHNCEGFAARHTLKFMDWVGNTRYGVTLPYNYWRMSQWQETFVELGLRREAWISSLHLYPWWADWWLGRGLHFIAFLSKQASPRASLLLNDPRKP